MSSVSTSIWTHIVILLFIIANNDLTHIAVMGDLMPGDDCDDAPTPCPTVEPSKDPTSSPTTSTAIPTVTPSNNPTATTTFPTNYPTQRPTQFPTSSQPCNNNAITACRACAANTELKCACTNSCDNIRWKIGTNDVTNECELDDYVDNCATHCSNDASGPYCCNGIQYENKCDAKCNTCFTESDCQPCVIIDCSKEYECEGDELTCSDDILCIVNCNAERACSNATIHRSQSIDLTVNCIGENACSNAIIDGSDVTDLEVNCNGENACSDATIDGSQTTALTLNCNGEKACNNAIIDGSQAINLEVNCIGEDACDGNTLNCGSGHCLLDCSQETSCLEVTLDGNGASCTESCGNANALINDKQETMHGHSIMHNNGIVKGAMGVGFVTLMIIITLVAICIRRKRRKKYLSNVKRLTAIMASVNIQKQTDTQNTEVETTENN